MRADPPMDLSLVSSHEQRGLLHRGPHLHIAHAAPLLLSLMGASPCSSRACAVRAGSASRSDGGGSRRSVLDLEVDRQALSRGKVLADSGAEERESRRADRLPESRVLLVAEDQPHVDIWRGLSALKRSSLPRPACAGSSGVLSIAHLSRRGLAGAAVRRSASHSAATPKVCRGGPVTREGAESRRGARTRGRRAPRSRAAPRVAP